MPITIFYSYETTTDPSVHLAFSNTQGSMPLLVMGKSVCPVHPSYIYSHPLSHSNKYTYRLNYHDTLP